jgi:putative flippase GtrA
MRAALRCLLKLSILAAGVLSFCAAALVNYRLTNQFVFKRDATLHGFALFFFAALTGLTINVGTILLGVFLFFLPPLAAKCAGIATAFLINFGLNLGVVFRSKV